MKSIGVPELVKFVSKSKAECDVGVVFIAPSSSCAFGEKNPQYVQCSREGECERRDAAAPEECGPGAAGGR